MSDAEESAKVRKLALAMLDLTKEHDCNLRHLYAASSITMRAIEQQVEHKLIEGIVGPELAKNL